MTVTVTTVTPKRKYKRTHYGLRPPVGIISRVSRVRHAYKIPADDGSTTFALSGRHSGYKPPDALQGVDVVGTNTQDAAFPVWHPARERVEQRERCDIHVV